MDALSNSAPLMYLDPESLTVAFDCYPLGFQHSLHKLQQFEPDALKALAQCYEGKADDYFVAASAPTPGTAFYEVATLADTPRSVLASLDGVPARVLLKRPENHDQRFRVLLDTLFNEVKTHLPDLQRERVVRLESAILITSAASTTPFHFDPESGFFSQIEGRKSYHVYPPDSLTEPELEQFYKRNKLNIGQVDITRRDAAREHLFELEPGAGFHQPRNAPHWVKTHDSRSVSYTMVFETESSRVKARARGMNHYLRKARMSPVAPGMDAKRDAAKSFMMQAATPVRRVAEWARHVVR